MNIVFISLGLSLFLAALAFVFLCNALKGE